jgi:hypothetical protein
MIQYLFGTTKERIANCPSFWWSFPINFDVQSTVDPTKDRRNVHGKLNASWKISSLAINGQSFLVIDGYL